MVRIFKYKKDKYIEILNNIGGVAINKIHIGDSRHYQYGLHSEHFIINVEPG
jgi:hypothetical protein